MREKTSGQNLKINVKRELRVSISAEYCLWISKQHKEKRERGACACVCVCQKKNRYDDQ